MVDVMQEPGGRAATRRNRWGPILKQMWPANPCDSCRCSFRC